MEKIKRKKTFPRNIFGTYETTVDISTATLPLVSPRNGETSCDGITYTISRAFVNVDATIGHQAFSQDRCNIFLEVNNTVLNSLSTKNDVEAQVEFTFKVVERASVTCY